MFGVLVSCLVVMVASSRRHTPVLHCNQCIETRRHGVTTFSTEYGLQLGGCIQLECSKSYDVCRATTYEVIDAEHTLWACGSSRTIQEMICDVVEEYIPVSRNCRSILLSARPLSILLSAPLEQPTALQPTTAYLTTPSTHSITEQADSSTIPNIILGESASEEVLEEASQEYNGILGISTVLPRVTQEVVYVLRDLGKEEDEEKVVVKKEMEVEVVKKGEKKEELVGGEEGNESELSSGCVVCNRVVLGSLVLVVLVIVLPFL